MTEGERERGQREREDVLPGETSSGVARCDKLLLSCDQEGLPSFLAWVTPLGGGGYVSEAKGGGEGEEAATTTAAAALSFLT